jgi:hypothetical protein
MEVALKGDLKELQEFLLDTGAVEVQIPKNNE